LEITVSLILLSVLVFPPLALALREVLDRLLFNETASLLAKKLTSKGAATSETENEQSAVYDGMITVEIPIHEPQVVAYEPVLPPGDEQGIEIIKA